MYTFYAPYLVFWVPTLPHSPPKPTPKPHPDQKAGYRIRIGNWEEVYDTVDGTKTWYNTVTEKTTEKDPFY